MRKSAVFKNVIIQKLTPLLALKIKQFKRICHSGAITAGSNRVTNRESFHSPPCNESVEWFSYKKELS